MPIPGDSICRFPRSHTRNHPSVPTFILATICGGGTYDGFSNVPVGIDVPRRLRSSANPQDRGVPPVGLGLLGCLDGACQSPRPLHLQREP